MSRAGSPNPSEGSSPSNHNWSQQKFTSMMLSIHPAVGDELHDTARPYRYQQQTWRIWRVAIAEYLATATLCGLYIASLAYYAHKDIMYPKDQAWLNAITQGITFLLSVSVIASFRSYAKFLRWRILAHKYRPLEIFDLILACDSLMNVLKLLFYGSRRRHGERGAFKRCLPSMIQIGCICWLILNVTVAFLVGYVAALSSLNAGASYVGPQIGNVSVTNFAALGGIDSDAHLSRMQTWASRGIRYTGVSGLDYSAAKLSTFSTLNNGTAAYWIEMFDTSDETNRVVSYLRIRSDTTCAAYTVTSGQFGNESSITYINDQGNPTNYPLSNTSQVGPGGVLASSHINSTCGPRCVNIDMFVAQTPPNAPIINAGRNVTVTYNEARFFKCNNTVSSVQLGNQKGTFEPAPQEFALGDSWAQMVAGAIGWQIEGSDDGTNYGVVDDSNGQQRSMTMFRPYSAQSELGMVVALQCRSAPNATQIAHAVSGVSMVSLVAVDDGTTGLQYFNTYEWNLPVRSQHLSFDAWGTAAIIGAIVLGQLFVLVLVFIFAHKAVIRDNSPIAMAHLYYPLLQRGGLGEVEYRLTTHEIVKKMDNCDVVYEGTISQKRKGGETRYNEDGSPVQLDDFGLDEKYLFSNR